MRTRFAALLLSAMLAASIGCSKKTETPATQTPPATADQTAQQPAATNPPAQNTQPGQQAAPAAAPVAETQAPPPPPPPPPLVVPAGTTLVIKMGSTLDTKTAEAGQPFTGTLARSVAVEGEVAIPAGAGVSGSVVESKSPGKFKGEGLLSISLNSIDVRGVPTQIATSTYTQTVKGKGKRTAVAVGGGTGAGALIGGLAGGGKGALIGGLVGAGAGTAGAAFTGNKDLQIPAESAVSFRLANSITVKRTGEKAKKAAHAGEEPAPQQ